MTTINTIEDLIRLLDENPEWLEALRKRLLTRDLLELPAKFDRFVEETNARFDRVEAAIGVLQADGRAMRAEIGTLKGWRAWDFVREDPSDIAEEMGLAYVKSLRRSDLTRLVRFSDKSGIEPSDLQSFRLADLIMEATDQAGETCYIAVEISFTVDERDTDRAIRNSAFLTRFTGQPSYPAVSGIYRDNRIDALTESGEVFWYQLPREIMIIE